MNRVQRRTTFGEASAGLEALESHGVRGFQFRDEPGYNHVLRANRLCVWLSAFFVLWACLCAFAQVIPEDHDRRHPRQCI